MVEYNIKTKLKTLKNARLESLLSMDRAIRDLRPIWEVREYSKIHDDLCNEYINLLSQADYYFLRNTEGDYTRSNGSGKSAVFESILWCLFNKSRVAMMDDIIRWGENTCQVSFEFINGGKTYRVIRKRNRSNSG